MTLNTSGELQLHKIELPAPGTPVVIDSSNSFEDSIRIIERVPVQSAVKIGYARNWTVQEELQTGIPQKHKDLFEKEWLTVTAEDAAVKSEYRQLGEPEQIDTFLLTESDASAEATRRLNLWKVQRHIYRIECDPTLITAQLSQAVTLINENYNLSSGEDGMIVGLVKNFSDFSVTLEVLA
jgi:hypothetical protein